MLYNCVITEIPKVRLDLPEVYDVADDSLSLRWNKVDIPTFSYDDEPLSFMIERQTLPGYQWEPVATNLTGTSYRIQDLKPYQDYAFRVRGVYPSGYTEPSPLVPVYRRPSESKVSLASRNISSSDSLKYYILANQNLPSQSLRSSSPLELPSLHRIRRERTSRSYSPERRYSLPYIFDDTEAKLKVSEMMRKPIRSQSPSFNKNDAYVYNRRKTEDIITNEAPFKPSYASHSLKESKVKSLTSQFENVRSRAIARRHSDVGLGLLSRPRTDSSKYYDSVLEERRIQMRQALAHKSVKPRSSSVPKGDIYPPLPAPDPEYLYRSVADRYEDIKHRYVSGSKALHHERPHSVAVDTYDFIKRYDLSDQSAHAPMTNAYVPTTYTDPRGAYSLEYTDYYDGSYFIIEDEMNMKYKEPLSRVSRVDMRLPVSHRSISYDRDPGYFMISKFSLNVSDGRRPSPTKSHFRHQSVEPLHLINRSRSNTSAELLRSRVKARSLTPDLDSLKFRSRSESLVRSYSPSTKQHVTATERSRTMSFTAETYKASVASAKQTTPVVKPRSSSFSLPARSKTSSSDRAWTRARAPAAILIDKSKTLVGKYERVPAAEAMIRPRSASLSAQPPPLKITTSSHSSMSNDRAQTKILIDQSKSLVGKSKSVARDPPKYNMSTRRASVVSFARPIVAPTSHETVVSRKSSVSVDLSRRDLQPRSKSLSVPPRNRGSMVVDTSADEMRLKLDALVGRLCTPSAKRKHYTPKVKSFRDSQERK